MSTTVTGTCNFLTSVSRVSTGSVPGRDAVKTFENWVGGHFTLTPEEFRFSVNKLNKAFQKGMADVVIPRGAISNARRGSMFLIFPTVDFNTPEGPCRVRTMGRNTGALLAALGAVT